MPIDRTSLPTPLIAVMRAELSRRGERARAGNSGAPASAPPPSSPRSLRAEVAGLVRGVDTQDPVAMRAARRRVIRAVLLAELGSELREYSQWQPMLDTLVDSLEANEDHREAFQALIRSVT
ncbi:hypothetical protein I5U67_07945 [Stenotrophomonas maltophilia]|uniref:Uncharacterized protein n=2 Tax=Stenotrophomonas maltophilia TaxID=40324 RepID=A0A6B8J028_STEMA|nr:hypothetical protein [Stenotrophomonas maltophilia]MBH1652097.1 hypothetical protein [Stenotrophomonas maltophilia]QGM00273.1 hypothetical protein FEO89_05785 [Stenotrophomonas maltophilia]HDS1508864.1 hypothetical protein [Stenotrophomonas maltophilia]